LRRLFIAALAAPLLAWGAYPEKPIRFVIPSAPGGSPDVLMRILTQQLSQQMKVAFVVENKPGASYVLGTMDIVKSAPDGYTLGYGNIVSLAINRSLLPNVPYDVERDLTLVSNCVQVFNFLAVNNNLPVRTVAELIDYAKKNPGKLTNGSSGNGTTGHLGGELFKSMTGVDMVHVPYKGAQPALADVIAGQCQLMFATSASVIPYIKAGRLRALAVTTAKRSPSLPDLPTVAEAGVPGFEAITWHGVVVPSATPFPVIERLNRAINSALRQKDLSERLTNLGAEIAGGTPQEFADYIAREIPKWAKVVKDSGARAE